MANKYLVEINLETNSTIQIIKINSIKYIIDVNVIVILTSRKEHDVI